MRGALGAYLSFTLSTLRFESSQNQDKGPEAEQTLLAIRKRVSSLKACPTLKRTAPFHDNWPSTYHSTPLQALGVRYIPYA